MAQQSGERSASTVPIRRVRWLAIRPIYAGVRTGKLPTEEEDFLTREKLVANLSFQFPDAQRGENQPAGSL